jgi:hypothetical protein
VKYNEFIVTMHSWQFTLDVRDITRHTSVMSTIDAFLNRCDRLANAAGWSVSTLSTRLLGSGTRLSEIRDGKDIGVRRMDLAVSKLEEFEKLYPVATPEGEVSEIAHPMAGAK